MGTPHINANPGDFANVVLMPGDPVRAKWIVETFLHDYKLVTDVRGILGFTGYTKNGKRISVMASGMGQPSIGIYSYELYTGYGSYLFALSSLLDWLSSPSSSTFNSLSSIALLSSRLKYDFVLCVR